MRAFDLSLNGVTGFSRSQYAAAMANDAPGGDPAAIPLPEGDDSLLDELGELIKELIRELIVAHAKERCKQLGEPLEIINFDGSTLCVVGETAGD